MATSTTLSPFLASSNELLGQQERHMDRRLSEVLFKPEANVFIDCGNGVDPIRAVIKSIVGSIAFVQFCDEKTLDEVKIDQLVIGLAPYPTSMYSFDNLFSLRNLDANQLMKPISTYIRLGHYFELIDKHDPTFVHTVKIMENRNGYVQALDCHNRSYSIILGSERCKRVGWSMLPKNDGSFNMEPFIGTTIKTIAPWFLFDRCQLKEHLFDLNHTLEVIDPVTRYRIVPGVITGILNKYYFRVTLLMDSDGGHELGQGKFDLDQGENGTGHNLGQGENGLAGQAKFDAKKSLTTIVCHRGSSDLLPANFCSRSSMRLTVPEDKENPAFDMYKQLVKGRQATESMFDIPKATERFDTNRKIEVFDEENQMMIPATILRQHRHLLVVRMENERDFSAPKLFAFYDERLFNAGAAKKFGLPLAESPQMVDKEIWKTEVPYKVVTRPSEHDPLNGKRFMCKVFSNVSQFLPKLYINFDCYKGPFINDETAQLIDTQISSCHFQPVMKYIIHGVLENVVKFEWQKFAIAQQQSQAPLYTVKLSNPKSDKRTRSIKVEVCESADQFPAWLRQFLLRLEICPNFISPVKRLDTDPCPYNCHTIEQRFPYMSPKIHVNSASAIPPSTLSRIDEQRIKRGPGNGNGASVPKRIRTDFSANNSDHNDLDEPLSIRRARRNITSTKRHDEIDLEEVMANWKRRQPQGANLPDQFLAAANLIQQQQRRRRNGSNDFQRYDPKYISMYNAQNVPPQTTQNAKEYLMEMASRISETIQGNLSSWDGLNGGSAPQSRERSISTSLDSTNGFMFQQRNEAIKAAAVRKSNGGPRMLFPQGFSQGGANEAPPVLQPFHRDEDQPPRLQPILERQQNGTNGTPLQNGAKKDDDDVMILEDENEEDEFSDDEILYLDDDNEEEIPTMEMETAPRLSAMKPTESMKIELNDKFDEALQEGVSLMGDYFRNQGIFRNVNGGQVASSFGSNFSGGNAANFSGGNAANFGPGENGGQVASNFASDSVLKLPAVQLEKPGEYDTEIMVITPPKLQRPSSSKSTLSGNELDELLAKYDMSHSTLANPVNWGTKELIEFMKKHHSQEVAEFLEKEEFDGQSFFMIEEEEIKDMKLKKGPELNLKRLLKDLKEIVEATNLATIAK